MISLDQGETVARLYLEGVLFEPNDDAGDFGAVLQLELVCVRRARRERCARRKCCQDQDSPLHAIEYRASLGYQQACGLRCCSLSQLQVGCVEIVSTLVKHRGH